MTTLKPSTSVNWKDDGWNDNAKMAMSPPRSNSEVAMDVVNVWVIMKDCAILGGFMQKPEPSSTQDDML